MKHRIDVDYYLRGEQLMPIAEFPKQMASESGLIYEVLRVINGKALFVEEHLRRLNISLRLASKPAYGLQNLASLINKLIVADAVDNGNLKLLIYIENDALIPYLYFIPHRYPTAQQYANGVKTLLQYDIRALPEVKIADWKVRGRANKLIDGRGVYETLLVNKEGEITEGSRSNVFFIRNKELYTAPDKMVLSGITRNKIIELAEKQHIPIHYEAVKIDDLAKCQAGFITGTSPGVIQMRSIEDFNCSINDSIYRLLLEAYNKLIQ